MIFVKSKRYVVFPFSHQIDRARRNQHTRKIKTKLMLRVKEIRDIDGSLSLTSIFKKILNEIQKKGNDGCCARSLVDHFFLFNFQKKPVFGDRKLFTRWSATRCSISFGALQFFGNEIENFFYM